MHQDTEMGRGDYLSVEVERTTHQDISISWRPGASGALFSIMIPERQSRGTISYLGRPAAEDNLAH